MREASRHGHRRECGPNRDSEEAGTGWRRRLQPALLPALSGSPVDRRTRPDWRAPARTRKFSARLATLPWRLELAPRVKTGRRVACSIGYWDTLPRHLDLADWTQG